MQRRTAAAAAKPALRPAQRASLPRKASLPRAVAALKTVYATGRLSCVALPRPRCSSIQSKRRTSPTESSGATGSLRGSLKRCEPGRSSVAPLCRVTGTSGMKALTRPASPPSKCHGWCFPPGSAVTQPTESTSRTQPSPAASSTGRATASAAPASLAKAASQATPAALPSAALPAALLSAALPAALSAAARSAARARS